MQSHDWKKNLVLAYNMYMALMHNIKFTKIRVNISNNKCSKITETVEFNG